MCAFLQLIHFSVVVVSLFIHYRWSLTVTLQLLKKATYDPDSKFQLPPPQSHMTPNCVLVSQPPFTSIFSFLGSRDHDLCHLCRNLAFTSRFWQKVPPNKQWVPLTTIKLSSGLTIAMFIMPDSL